MRLRLRRRRRDRPCEPCAGEGTYNDPLDGLLVLCPHCDGTGLGDDLMRNVEIAAFPRDGSHTGQRYLPPTDLPEGVRWERPDDR